MYQRLTTNAKNFEIILEYLTSGVYFCRCTVYNRVMTNNNNKKAINCACGDMGVSEFVAGNQCFRCEQVDNRHAGITFTTGVCGEWDAWFKQIGERVVAFKAGPKYIDPSRYA